MTTTMVEAVEEMKQLTAVYRQGLESVAAEVKRLGTQYNELEKWPGEWQGKYEKMDSRFADLETKLRRMPVGGQERTDHGEGDEKKRLYTEILRAGDYSRLSDQEKAQAKEWGLVKVGSVEAKALGLGDDTLGGFLSPPEFVQDIIKGVQLISPMRSLANVRTTARRSVQYPVRAGVFAAQWVGEMNTRTETAGLAYSLEEIPVFEMYAEVLVSEQDLEDSAFDLQAEILDNASEQIAKAEGAAFVSGDGIKKPEGVLTSAAVGYSPSGLDAKIGPAPAANVASGDGIVNLWGALKTAYTTGAQFILNRKTLAAARKLMDNQSRYLWEPSYAAGAPASLFGSPYTEMPDMPDVASNSFPIMYGNYKRAYTIVDRVDVVVKRLVEKYAEQGQIAFIVRKRLGGQVVLPEAVLKLKCSVS